VKAYWWKGDPDERVSNFGDMMTPLLLRYFSGVKARWAPLAQADIVVTGSLLHHIPARWQGTVAGVGLLRDDLPVHLRDATVLALRGPLSAAHVPGDYALGDPGLLADEFIPYPEKRYDLGVLPHWTDRQLHLNPIFSRYRPLVLNPGDKPLKVIKQIGQCRKLVTSSLHGMILADAFGIPRRFETTERFTLDTLFKFHDYSASIDLPLEIGVTQQADRNKVETLKHSLWDVFEGLR
jgi:pyruvyltransferase